MDFPSSQAEEKAKSLYRKGFWITYKWRIRLQLLSGIDPAEIVIAYTNAEIMQLWMMYDDWQRPCNNFLGDTNNKYPERMQLQLTKKLNGFFPS